MAPITLPTLLRSSGWVLLAAIALSAIFWGGLLRDLEQADASFRARDLPAASEGYQEALAGFDRIPLLRRLLRGSYLKAVHNQAQVLYAQGRFREVVDLLQREADAFPLLAGTAPYHLWLGNAFFRIAILEEGEELSFESLQTVAEEYREAIGLDRNNWDARHNYDFVRDLLSRKSSEDPQAGEQLQLLMSRIRSSTQRQASLPAQLH